MTRDNARAAFASAGLTYETVDFQSLKGLRYRIDREMRKSGAMNDTFRCRRTKMPRWILGRMYAELRCKSDYFDDREAVTFNTNGFIGFAGWADEENVQPILKGFIAWVETIKQERTA